jgi:nucleoside-diphosphate-sugar epimerase
MRRSAVALTGLPQRVRCDYTQRILGWKPEVRFADGMRRAFEWYRQEYGDER